MAHCGALQHVGAYRQPPRWLVWGIVLAAGLCIAAGIAACWRQPEAPPPDGYRSTCGALLVLLGLCQLAIVWRLSRLGAAGSLWATRAVPPSQRMHARGQAIPRYRQLTVETAPLARLGRSLLVGAVVCYFLAAAVGETSLWQVYAPALALWYTLSLAVVTIPSALWRWLVPISNGPAVRWLGRLITCAAMAVAGAEAGLRVWDLFGGHRLRAAYLASTSKLLPGSVVQGRTVNSLGYWDDEFSPLPAPGIVRIAAMGRGSTLWGPVATNVLTQIEGRIPGIEVYNFALAHGTPQQYAAQLAGDVAAHHPHLVLTFVSTADDLVDEVPAPAWSSARSLRLYQVLSQVFGTGSGVPPPKLFGGSECVADYEAYLNHRARALAMFRTPIEPEVERRWQVAFAELGRLMEECRRRELPLALVLVPDELQYRPVVREALCRRVGCPASQLDVDLPQRRLVRFADRHELPTLDLLPFFRASKEPLAAPGVAGWTPHAHRLAGEAIGHWLAVRFGSLIAAAERRAAPGKAVGRSGILQAP